MARQLFTGGPAAPIWTAVTAPDVHELTVAPASAGDVVDGHPATIGRTIAAVALPPALAGLVVALTDAPAAATLLVALVAAGVATWTTLQLVVRPLVANLAAARSVRARVEAQLAAERADRELRTRLERALRHAESEPAALRVGLRAVAEAVPDASIELLLSVPGEPRVAWRVPLHAGEPDDAVPVPDTPTCASLASGRSVVAATSSLDACGHVESDGAELSIACVPMSAGAEPVGVVCLATAPGEPLDRGTLERVEWIVERVGLRAAEHRAAAGAAHPGRADPLTGLPDAATLRPHLKDMVRSLTPFCLAMAEVDRFDEIDDDAAADAALVTLAQVLCETVRPDDLICRQPSGFAVVLGGCSDEQAVAIMERVRERLALAITEVALVESAIVDLEGSHPPVTCSMGVVESRSARSLDEIVDRATEACDRAAAAGGNRVTVSSRQ